MEKKKSYSKPFMVLENFNPEEYIGACLQQVSELPPGEYRIGWCIRDATGEGRETAVSADGKRTGYFLQAPTGFSAGQNINDLVAETINSSGNTVACKNYPDYQWYDYPYSGGSGQLTKGDQIIFNGIRFTLEGNDYSTLAVPSSAIFSVSGHS